MIIEESIDKDLAKEAFIFLSYTDNPIIDSIPSDILKKISEKAADSDKEFYIDKDKSLDEQNISEECKDFLGLLYYIYVLDKSSQDQMLNKWIINEKKAKNED